MTETGPDEVIFEALCQGTPFNLKNAGFVGEDIEGKEKENRKKEETEKQFLKR